MSCSRMASFEDLVEFDRSFKRPPVRFIAGVDEAGRGALAGPVVAAAVICEPCGELSGVRDSKLLPEKKREELYELIREKSINWSVGIAGPEEIDGTNILKATLRAMKEALEGLSIDPCLVLIDGRQVPETEHRSQAVTGGDGRSFSIAAASIIAKVTRDRIMRRMERTVPGYGFVRNKGYGTMEHLEALEKLGRSGIHRKTFRIRGNRGGGSCGREEDRG